MLDNALRPKIDPWLMQAAVFLKGLGLTPNQLTVVGFVIGLAAMVAIMFGSFLLGLLLFLSNRLLDGLDGALARLGKPSQAGAYLDIVFDFIIYSGIVFACAVERPEVGLVAAFTIFSFIGTGSSFLAMAIFANDAPTVSNDQITKGFYYLAGLTEGFETMLFIALILMFPSGFQVFALVFGILCWITTAQRIRLSYRYLSEPGRGR